MTAEPVKGPASYFPSIEKKYGRPVSEWQEVVRQSYPAKHAELVAILKSEHALVTATPTPSSQSPWRRTEHRP